MQVIFEKVQTQFMNLGTLLCGLDLEKDLSKLETLTRVNEVLNETYILLNQGFCENHLMCEECASHRDQLSHVSTMLDECEENCIINEETYLAVSSFRDNIPVILRKMESVYIDMMEKVK